MTFSERLNIIRLDDDQFIREKNLRGKTEYEGVCSEEDFANLASWWNAKSGGKVDLQQTIDGEIKYTRKKSRWERFEDKVWRTMIDCGMKFASSGLQVVRYGNGPKQIKQVDGIFADDDFVYIVEAKYRTLANGKKVKDSKIKDDVVQFRSFFHPLKKRIIEKIPEFSDKEFVFILASKSVDLSDIKHELSMNDFGYYITDDTLDDFNEISGKLSSITNSIFRSEVMRGRKLNTEPMSVYALKTEWSGTVAYSFFANPTDMADRFYVHKRSPDRETSIGMAYQRMMKPGKVGQISTYLKNTEGFFPNSIIAHCEEVKFEPSGAQGELGLLTIPHTIGSIWIIDGQHRVFGSMDSGVNRNLNICLLVNTKDVQQARLFTTINEKQTKIPLDLIWDLHGSLSTYTDEPKNASEREELRKFFISKTWKKMNNDKDSPFLGRIIIPSETIKSQQCHIKFGFLCKYLNQTTLWEQNGLRSKKWKNAHIWSARRVKSYFSGIKDELEGEWNKSDRSNWLLSQYSLMVQLMVFRRAVTMVFNSTPLNSQWTKKDEAEKLSYELGKGVALAISSMDEYEHEIRNAGNIAMRTKWMKNIISFLKKNHSEYKYLDHGLEMDDQDKDDDLYLNPKEKDTLAEVEKMYRKIVFQAYSNKYSEDWFSNIPGEVVKTINKGVKTRKKFGEKGLDEPSEDYLSSTNLGELMVCIEHKGVWPALSKHFLCNKDELKFHWSQVNLLRASEAHNYAIPDKSTKTTWLASLEHVRRWGEDAFSSILSDQD